MKFLVDADLPRAVTALLRRASHDAADVRERGLAAASDEVVAALAQAERRVLLTAGFDFADVRNYPPDLYAGIVVLTLRPTDTRDRIVTLVSGLIARTDLLAVVPGRLAVVDHEHVRFRPALA